MWSKTKKWDGIEKVPCISAAIVVVCDVGGREKREREEGKNLKKFKKGATRSGGREGLRREEPGD